MSIVARGFGLEPTALVGPAAWGFTLKGVVPPPVSTTVDPYAKHANTQVIRESHLRKFLRRKKREVERVDLDTQKVLAAGLVPTTVKTTEQALVAFGPEDARHLEKAVRVIAKIAVDPNYLPGVDEVNVIAATPEVLKKIH